MNGAPQYLRSKTMHARRGELKNRFVYNMDMMLIDPDAPAGRGLFSRNRFNIFAIHDADYGFQDQRERPSVSMRQLFENAGLVDFDLRLLTQPRVMGALFNPVSFWIAFREDAILGFVAEVNNTFHERHFYLCHHPDFAPIKPKDEILTKKIFYVSPFQEIAGEYGFRVQFDEEKYAIRIDFRDAGKGVLATLAGSRAPLTNRAILAATIIRPIGGLRVIGLIFYQALKLKTKGARYRRRPTPPSQEVSS